MQESIQVPDWREEVRKKVERAMATALPVQEERERRRINAVLSGQLNRGEITAEEHDVHYRSGEEGVAFFETMPEFAEALKILGLLKEEIEEILAHENEHYLVAGKHKDRHGLKVRYAISLGRDGDEFNIKPAVVVDFPADVKKEEKVSLFREIAKAPGKLKGNDKIAHG